VLYSLDWNTDAIGEIWIDIKSFKEAITDSGNNSMEHHLNLPKILKLITDKEDAQEAKKQKLESLKNINNIQVDNLVYFEKKEWSKVLKEIAIVKKIELDYKGGLEIHGIYLNKDLSESKRPMVEISIKDIKRMLGHEEVNELINSLVIRNKEILIKKLLRDQKPK
jgi:hypothetical protein